MKHCMEILNASLLWRWLDTFCRWVGRQWERSALVHWFLHPAPWGQAASEHSLFFKLWNLIRGGLCRLYAVLKLDKLFKGSVFTQTWLWCAIPVVLAPLLDFWRPSIMVVGLALGAVAISFGMSLLFRRFYTGTYSVIFGIFLSMIPNMLTENCRPGWNGSTLASLLLLAAGFGLSWYLGDLENNNRRLKKLLKERG